MHYGIWALRCDRSERREVRSKAERWWQIHHSLDNGEFEASTADISRPRHEKYSRICRSSTLQLNLDIYESQFWHIIITVWACLRKRDFLYDTTGSRWISSLHIGHFWKYTYQNKHTLKSFLMIPSMVSIYKVSILRQILLYRPCWRPWWFVNPHLWARYRFQPKRAVIEADHTLAFYYTQLD